LSSNIIRAETAVSVRSVKQWSSEHQASNKYDWLKHIYKKYIYRFTANNTIDVWCEQRYCEVKFKGRNSETGFKWITRVRVTCRGTSFHYSMHLPAQFPSDCWFISCWR
jgi:hypothetical protein